MRRKPFNLRERLLSTVVEYSALHGKMEELGGYSYRMGALQYRQKAERLSSLMRREPFNLRERLLSTVEFSALHGKLEELGGYSYRTGALQYFCLDVIFVILVMVALQITAFAYGIRKISDLVLSRKKGMQLKLNGISIEQRVINA
ncbi:hypothetical protein OSTOST_10210, partial [Ostertagia ostertagi]